MERSLIRQLETNLQKREEALRQKLARIREGPEGGTNGCWELKGAPDNSQLQADQDCQAWEGNWRRARYTAGSKSMARSGGDYDEEGLRTDQTEDPGMEEPCERNLHRREGSRTPSLAEGKSHTSPEPLRLSQKPPARLPPPGNRPKGGATWRIIGES